MGFNNIEKKNLFYKMLHKYAIFAHNKLFYRKVYISNAQNIPENAHLIFTPNHQNALMDALAPLCNIDKQLVFLARSDIFKKKFVAAILYFLKILPIFRIRDGYSAVKKNKSIFQKTIDVIKAQNGLAILPEGNHEGIHQLRTLKKGFARIAFQTEEASDFTLDIKIVPIGLHYSDYIKSRSDLYINFGKAISISDYYELYKESAPKAINKLTADLADKIKPLMVHIESAEYYDFYDSIRKLYWREMCSTSKDAECANPQRIYAEQTAIKLLSHIEKEHPERFKELNSANNFYTKELNKLKFTDGILSKPEKFLNLTLRTLLFLIGIPFFILGLISNLIPFVIVKYAESKIKDLQFKSSFKFVLAIFIFPLYYLIIMVILIVFCSSIYICLIIAMSLPITGFFAVTYNHALSQLKTKWKVWLFKTRSPVKFENLASTKAAMNQIVNGALIGFKN
jgi:1-acyl-sn-glycerol-3-phosphate acyltransferase/uncharacterized membrane protein